MESPSCHRSHTRRRGGRPTRSQARAYKSPSAWPFGLVGSTREASKSAGCSVSEPGSPEISGPREVDCGGVESAETIGDGRRPVSGAGRLGVGTVPELSGVVEGDMPAENVMRKLGTTLEPRSMDDREKAAPITCSAGKWRGAGEWGGWGQISVDGQGQHNLDRSEGPWGRAARPLERWRSTKQAASTQSEGTVSCRREREGRVQTFCWASQSWGPKGGKAPSEMPALEPYCAKSRRTES